MIRSQEELQKKNRYFDKQPMGYDTRLAFWPNVPANCPRICWWKIFSEWDVVKMSGRTLWGSCPAEILEDFHRGKSWQGWHLSRKGIRIPKQDYKLSLCGAVVIWATGVNTQIQTDFDHYTTSSAR